MMNTYLRLVVLVLAVLVALAVLHIVLPLLITAAIVAAVILGGMFLVNCFRKQMTSAKP